MEDDRQSEKIKLVLINGVAHVWTAKDWEKLRKLRIIGCFIGNLAALPRQDQLAGLPLTLLKEETSLLLEKGFAVLKVLPSLSDPPCESICKQNEEVRNKFFEFQTEEVKRKRKQEIESKIDIILQGKKAKRKCLEGKELDKDTILEEEFKKLDSVRPNPAVQIFTGDPWITEEDYKDCNWEFPKEPIEKIKYLIFKDLWERKYSITAGNKFGGDYLVYPGDPVAFHAFFIVICLEKDKLLDMSSIVTYGRLGQSVRKTVVLAYLDENNEILKNKDRGHIESSVEHSNMTDISPVVYHKEVSLNKEE